jgi:hypothetical protein
MDVLSDKKLMFEFQSLGEDCEFSFIQRRFGAEPLEMLRFTATGLDELLAGLKSGFSAIGDPDQTYFEVAPNKEVWCVNRKHRFYWHTFLDHATTDLVEAERQTCKRHQFLRRKFFEDMGEGRKISIYKRRAHVSFEEVEALYKSMREYGPTTLLWVVERDDDHEPGTVERLADGFLKGYIDTFTTFGRARFGSDVWLSICRNALPLREIQFVARQRVEQTAFAEPGPEVNATGGDTAAVVQSV